MSLAFRGLVQRSDGSKRSNNYRKWFFDETREGMGKERGKEGLIGLVDWEGQIYVPPPLFATFYPNSAAPYLWSLCVFNNRPCIFHRTRRQIFKCAAAAREFKADFKSAPAIPISCILRLCYLRRTLLSTASVSLSFERKGKREKERKKRLCVIATHPFVYRLIISISTLYVFPPSPVIK